MTRKMLGQYIVADSEICHGRPTFVGTRIMVHQIVGMVARGMDWDRVVAAWGGKVSKEAIGEALQLAADVFTEYGGEYVEKQPPAA